MKRRRNIVVIVSILFVATLSAVRLSAQKQDDGELL
jgi:hypothetical protein